MVTIYCDGSYESFNLIRQLDDREIPYEAKNQFDAQEMGFYDLPILVVDNRVYKFKKALKWLRKQGSK